MFDGNAAVVMLTATALLLYNADKSIADSRSNANKVNTQPEVRNTKHEVTNAQPE